MAALAANAIKNQRKKAANQAAANALSNVNEQRIVLANVAQRHRDSLSSVSTLDSLRQDPSKVGAIGRPPRPRRPAGGQDDPRRRSKLDKSENEDGTYQASGSANIILYVGLGMICIGLVITFVGLGDKGFRTLELKLIGPSLVGCGLFFALLRVLFCTVPSCCRACCKCCRKEEDTEELIYAAMDEPHGPPPKTGYVAGNSTNLSATFTHEGGQRSSTNGFQKSAARKRSGKSRTDPENVGDFQAKTLKSVRVKGEGDSKGSGGAKPISYDAYSTDTSSQFSVDIVEVAPRNLELEAAETASKKSTGGPAENGGEGGENPPEDGAAEDGPEIVLNASRLQVESEK